MAPGHRADLVLLDDLEDCAVNRVIRNGKIVGPHSFDGRPAVTPVGLASVKLEPVADEDFIVPSGGSVQSVIGLEPGRILTEHRRIEVPVVGGRMVADPSRDLLKICVLARHGSNRNIGRGFVQGFGIAEGALASSVGHDSHNICVVGASDADMRIAVNRLIELQGGFVAVRNGQVVGELALPLAGLMSLEPFETVEVRLRSLRAAVRAMGCPLAEPFLQLAFLPLPVIPHLKITDRGMVDVDRFELIAA